jgi:thioredoxin:protein disulfide reductase
MARRFVPLLVACLFVLPVPAGAVDKDTPFDAKVHCPTAAVQAGSATELVVEYEVFSHDFFIYRDMSDILMDDPGGLVAADAVFPKGQVKYDKVSEQDREIFLDNFRVQVPLTVPADAAGGSHVVKLRAKYQGCNKPENYCLFPAKKELSCDVQVVASAAPASDAGADAQGGPAVAEGDQPAAGDDDDSALAVEPVAEVAVVQAASDDGRAPISTRPLGAITIASTECADEAGSQAGLVAKITGWLTGKLEGSDQGGGGPGFFFLLLVFLGGLASSLTPCVYPMIPITVSVIGASADQSRAKAFALSVVYVLGIAATYTVLGLAAAQSGGMFGAALQNPWVLVGVAIVMLALSLSMFGLYEFALPEGVTTKASMAGGGGFVGAFVVGAVAGVVAAPCTGPIVIMLLGVIGAQGWGLLAGGLVMLVYSLGLGMLFLAVGTFAGVLSTLPQSGNWMVTVKYVFGVVLVGAAVFYAGQAVSVHWAGETAPLWAAALVTEGWVITVIGGGWVIAGGFDMAGEGRSWKRIVLGAVVLLVGLYWAVAPEEHLDGVQWSDQYGTSLVEAKEADQPIILDFTADWCTACKELEHKTYTDPAVLRCSSEFTTVMIDGTKDTPEFVELKARYGIKGLPAVYFMCPDGSVVQDLTLKGFEPAGTFLEKMNVALNTCRGEAS